MSEWTFLTNTALPVLISVIPWMIRVHAKLAVVEHQIKELCGKLDNNAAMIRDLWSQSNELSCRITKLEEVIMYRANKRNKRKEEKNENTRPD